MPDGVLGFAPSRSASRPFGFRSLAQDHTEPLVGGTRSRMPAAPSLRSSSCGCAVLEGSAYAAPRIPKGRRPSRGQGGRASVAPLPAAAVDRVGTNVFVGHGRAAAWRELKDFVQDRLGLPWDEYNRVPVAGMTNIARLSEMLDASAIAPLVMTAEDEWLMEKSRPG
jgi:hypothetical protein